jgi:hypothetical protein
MNLRYQQIKTDKIIPKNKLDIIIGDKSGNENGMCLLTDTALSGDINVVHRAAQRILNFK